LDQNQPELMSFLEIAGNVSIGDSITLAMALAAGTRDMDMIQVHSMGWVNPPSTGPSKNPTKVGKKV
jgi:succinate dehydrogenase/fumarate reductase flavoprotein subunit